VTYLQQSTPMLRCECWSKACFKEGQFHV